ncbi:hypothetical protein ACFQ9J_27275 [Streptomyces sp. NPDC056529]|uniref:hypothetical protein n=1 Tax=Streptomyces sp. NPDC056529 TaxID=3345855 RepID=UPI0036777F30
MPYAENDHVAYRDGRPGTRRGRIEEVRDEGPHAVYRIRNDATDEIQVVTEDQIVSGPGRSG